jgi:hypothetical protein
MKCPHCLNAFYDNPEKTELGIDKTSRWLLVKRQCPSCQRFILSFFEYYERYRIGNTENYHKTREIMCYPKAISRTPLSDEVPEEYASDYREACFTLADSSKASAALSRRCLQHLLREKAKVKPGDLASEIQQVLDEGRLPSQILESLDAIRNIGNFAAHPIKSKSTGEIIEVETGEAEWNLDVLEALFDYFFVQPALLQKKREALNAKLKAAGKPEMK